MSEIINLINEMSPFLLLGFLLAGVMKAFVPTILYQKYLSKNRFSSVINATLIGIPLPLCSCGVLPTAMGLHRQGASKGATTSFLIATPQTGVDSIIATYSLLGLPLAIIRPIAAIVTSIVGGSLVNIFDKDKNIELEVKENKCSDANKTTLKEKLLITIKFAFVEMMQDIGKWLMIGLIIAGAITLIVPESFFATFANNSLLSILLVLLFSIPMYLCATGSIPIAVALMLKGLSPGAALVLLMAGPAINAASILVLNKVLGRKVLTIYLFSIISGAIAFALCIDYLLPREWFTSHINAIKECCITSTPLFNTICTIALFVLLLNAFILKQIKRDKCSCSSTNCNCDHTHYNIEDKNKIEIGIEGMRCNHCKTNVEHAILSVKGVEKVDLILNEGKAIIYGTFDIEKITKAIESLGFKVKN